MTGFTAADGPAAVLTGAVSRIDNAYGDRHLVCSCPPPKAYADG